MSLYHFPKAKVNPDILAMFLTFLLAIHQCGFTGDDNCVPPCGVQQCTFIFLRTEDKLLTFSTLAINFPYILHMAFTGSFPAKERGKSN